MGLELSNDAKVTVIEAAAAAGTDTLTSDIVDMAGYESCLFLVTVATAAADNVMKCQQDTDSAGGTMADLEGSSLGVGSSDETLWYDIHQPKERYLRVILTRGTSTASGPIYAIQYNRKGTLPVDNTTSGTIYGEIAFSPDEGTA